MAYVEYELDGKTIKARVMQKTDTLANWEANQLPLLSGEQAFVVDSGGAPINFKIGDGTKIFNDLPWWIDYSGGQYVQVAGNELPAPTVELGYTFVGPGTYTFGGQPDVVAPDGRFSQLVWNGTVWSLKDMGALPAATGKDSFDPSGIDIANERATAKFVDKLIDIESFNLPAPTDKPSGFGILQQGVFTQGSGDDIVVPTGFFGLGKYTYVGEVYNNKYNGNFSVGALRIVGTVDGTASTYRRLGITSPSSMITTDDSENLFYTGKINNATYAGVLYYDAALTLLGSQFDGVGSWNRAALIKPVGTVHISMCSDVDAPVIEILQDSSEWSLAQLVPIPEDPNSTKSTDFEISPASENVFDKRNDLRNGFSLSSAGIALANATSSMSEREALPDELPDYIGVWGRVRTPFVFYNSSGGRIASSFGEDYNSGPTNGVYPVPSNAVSYDFAINYQGDGAGTEENIMVIYGYGTEPEEPTEYIPFKEATATAITINGIRYPFQVEGGNVNPDPSSVKMRVKYTLTDEVIIISDFDEGQFLKTVFAFTGNNMTFLPNSSGTVTAATFSEGLFDAPIESNLLQWNVSDGIGPYRLVNEVINDNDFVGGNHGAPEPANTEPPYYDNATSETVSHEIWADGIKLQPGDRVDVQRINVRVVNQVYRVDGFYVDPVVENVDFHEIQESEFANNQLSLKVRLRPVREGVQFKTVYGLQMQLGLALQHIFFPKSLYTGIETRSVNPNDSVGRSYGDKDTYNSFDRFYAMNTARQLVSSVWINTQQGLGTRSNLLGTSPIARGKTLKLYHNLLDIITSVALGEEIFYQGGVNLFSNKYSLEQAFVYEQEVKGEYEWEKRNLLVIDFANTSPSRTISVNVPKGKTLTRIEQYGDVTSPIEVVAESFEVTCTTGAGGIKYLIAD